MRTARLSVELPDWLWVGELSRSYPAAEFRLLTGIPVADGAVELGEVRDGPIGSIVSDAVAHPSIRDHEVLHRDEERVLAQVHTDERRFYEFARELAVPPEFPLVVRSSWLDLQLTATADQLQAFQEALAAEGWAHEVRSILRHDSPDELLTDRQQEVLRTAWRAGYYEVPHGCTLEALADRVDADPSTVQGILRRAEQRLVASHLGDRREG